MSDKFMKMGASDRYFYYTMTGRSTLNERVAITFKEEFDLKVMKEAADEALRLVPEFNKSIVISEGHPEAVIGSGDVAFIPDIEDRIVHFASDETNGLLFFFRYKDKKLTFSTFHGLTDAYGMKFFLRIMLCSYMKRKGLVKTPEDKEYIASMLCMRTNLDEEDMYTPYEKYGDASVDPVFHYENHEKIFAIPETIYNEECKYVHTCNIEAPLSDINALRNQFGKSNLPFFVDILSTSVARTFNASDKMMMIMSAVDQRKSFSSKSLVNCSDSIFFPYTAELQKKDTKTRYNELCSMMKQQLIPQLHVKIAGDKVLTVREFEKSPEGVVKIAERLEHLPTTDNFNPMTYILSFLGDQSMGKTVDILLENVVSFAFGRGKFVLISYFGDKMQMRVVNQSDSSEFAEGIVREFLRHGINAKITEDYRFYGDQLQYEDIETI